MAKTKTEELREKLEGTLAVIMATYRREMQRCIELQAHEEGQRVKDKHVKKILKACQSAGLAFAVEDAELPKGHFYKSWQKTIYDTSQQEMLKAGFRQTKEIELT